jgi:hypothetical protein
LTATELVFLGRNASFSCGIGHAEVKMKTEAYDMNDRDRALDELKRRISEQKARIDPRLLKLAESAALRRLPGESAAVPFDRESSAKAVELFLRHHADPRGFERRLAEFAQKNRC